MNLFESETLTSPELSADGFQHLFIGSPVAMLIEDSEGQIVDANEAAIALVRGERHDLVGTDAAEVLPPRMKADASSTGTNPGQLLTADGSSVAVQTLSVAIKQGLGEATLISLWEDAGKGALDSDAVFAGGAELCPADEPVTSSLPIAIERVAMMLNDRLTPIAGFASLIREGATRGRLDLEHLTEISRAADEASSMAHRMLAFAKPVEKSELEHADLASLIDSFQARLEAVAGEASEITMHLAADLPEIEVDSEGLCFALEQIVCNASEANASGGSIEICVDVDDDGQEVSIAVSDQGAGVSPEAADLIFEPFFTAPEGRNSAGLGLALAEAQMQRFGGRIELANPGEEEGATFVLRIPTAAATQSTTVDMNPINEPTLAPGASSAMAPMAPATTPPAPVAEPAAPALAPVTPEKAQPAPRQTARGGKETVLVVEDEEMVRDLVKRSLGYLGYDVLDACNGEEGLEVARQRRHEIDMVFSDIVMPRMSGPEMVAKMTEEKIDLPVLYTTGFTDNKRLLDNGEIREGVNLLPKPYTTKVLAARVREVLDGVGK